MSVDVLGDYRAPHWTVALHDWLPIALRRVLTVRRVGAAPLALALLLLAFLSSRLDNTAFIDEALYVNAGRDYIDHWITGSPVGYYGDSFSGVPFVYPVLAAVLDGLGGLALVRWFSLACVLVATVSLHRVVARLESRRAADLAAVMFAVCGPVVFAGHLGTFDAVVVALLAVGADAAVRARSGAAAAAAGAVLGVVPVVKYTGAVLVPAVLALVLLLATDRLQAHRAGLTAAVAVVVPLLAWLAWSDQIRNGVVFTTTGRKALSPYPPSALLGWMVLDVGVLLVTAVVGLALLARRGRRCAFVALVLLGAGLALPVAQMRLGEAVSFDKHLAYSALFLAPAAGCALACLSRRTWRLGPVVLVLAVALLFGASRSSSLFQNWVNVRPVIDLVRADPAPGLYLSSAADPLAYHTGDLVDVRWETTFTLYAEGDGVVRAAVQHDRYRRIVLRSASTGAPDQDRGQRVLVDALRNNPDYRLTTSFPARSDTDRWLIFDLVRAR